MNHITLNSVLSLRSVGTYSSRKGAKPSLIAEGCAAVHHRQHCLVAGPFTGQDRWLSTFVLACCCRHSIWLSMYLPLSPYDSDVMTGKSETLVGCQMLLSHTCSSYFVISAVKQYTRSAHLEDYNPGL